MQLYILDDNNRQDKIFDGWFSFIWTERYADLSSFKIEMPNIYSNRVLLKEGAILMISESDQPQVVETCYIKKQQDGSVRYIVEGRALTCWLELRGAPWDKSYVDTRVSSIAYNLMDRIIVDGTSADRLPDVTIRNDATDGARYDFETTPGTLLSNIQDILNDNACAIRADRIEVDGKYSFRFRLYNGTRKSVQFSDKDDTLVNSQRIQSRKKLRNVAIVAYKASNKEDAKTLFRTVYGNGGNASKVGLDRRIVQVDATSINPNDYPGTRLNTVLDRMGRAALVKQKYVDAIDGDVPAYSPAKYNRDYKLGDIIKYRSDDDVSTDARIKEYVWIIDQEGYREYPTIDVMADITV